MQSATDAHDDELSDRFWIEAGSGRRGALAVVPTATSPRWEAFQRTLLQRWAIRHIARQARALPLARTVEIGSGIGDFTRRLAAISRELLAVDVAPGFVAQTSQAVGARAGVSCRLADVRVFDGYQDADLVAIGCVLMYLREPDLHEVLARVRAQVHPGALLYQREYVCRAGVAAHRGSGGAYFRHAAAYRAAALAHGFRPVAEARSPALFVEQAVHDSLGLGQRWLSATLAAGPTLLLRAAIRLQPGYSWSVLYRAS